MKKQPDPDTLLPLTPAVYHIILVLAAQDRHGYGIMQEVAKLTDRQIQLGPGTLYRSLKQMLEWGLIEDADERPDPALDDERRRYYRLTVLGRQVGQAEARRLEQLVRRAHAVRLVGEDGSQPKVAGGH